MRNNKIIGTTLIIILLSILYYPSFHWLVDSWLHNDYYGHGFLIPIVSGWLIWRKRHELKKGESSSVGAAAFAFGLLLYITGFVMQTQFLLCISFLVIATSLILYFFGAKAMRALMFPIGFLIFMIPPPFLNDVGYQLQSMSTHGSTALLRMLGLDVTMDGSQIILDNSVFDIAPACSGMHSLISLLALAALFAYIVTAPLHKKIVLFLVAVPLAIIANILRITSLILIANHYDADVVTGWVHDMSSPAAFLLALFCLVLLAKILGCSIAMISSPETETS